LYMDSVANRWRKDTTGPKPFIADPANKANVLYNKTTSVSNGTVFQYYPTNPNIIASREQFKDVADKTLNPFSDPRNAGMVSTAFGNTGTRFDVAGNRIVINAAYLTFGKATCDASVVAEEWKGMPCWRVRLSRDIDPTTQCIREYVVVPQWDNSVVQLETKTFQNGSKTPRSIFSVETEVALYEKKTIWFPSKVHYQATVNDKIKSEEIAEFQVVSLNEPIEENVFNFKGMGVPKGHTVNDLADKVVVKKVWDGADVVRPMAGNSPLHVTADSSPWRWKMIFGASAIIACLAGVLWYRGHLRSRRANE
jgi:hypothetical protein